MIKFKPGYNTFIDCFIVYFDTYLCIHILSLSRLYYFFALQIGEESSNFYTVVALNTSDVDETLRREEVAPHVLNCSRQQNGTVIGDTCRTPNG